MRFPPGAGRMDPVSALWIGLRDRPAGADCAMDVRLFDGVKEQRVRLAETARDANSVTCAGQMERLAGYTRAELAEATHFPLSVTFVFDGERLRADRAVVGTIHGRVVLLRR